MNFTNLMRVSCIALGLFFRLQPLAAQSQMSPQPERRVTDVVKNDPMSTVPCDTARLTSFFSLSPDLSGVNDQFTRPLLLASLSAPVAPSPQIKSSPAPQCTPAPPVANPWWAVSYGAYIPDDHVPGPITSLGCGLPYVYLGDRSADPTKGGTLSSYRITHGVTYYPRTASDVPYLATVGYTWQFAHDSPANGSYITYPDYDGVPNDCHYYNAYKQANATLAPNYYNETGTYYPSTALIYLNGRISNPLENSSAAIQWNATVSISNITADGYWANVKASGVTTCYPYHVVIVNGVTVAYYPASPGASALHIFNCLYVQGPTYPLYSVGGANGVEVESE